MEKLIELDENNQLIIKPEALAIKAYKAIWDKDKSTHKDTAIKELMYVWFMASLDKYNPYKEYSTDIRGDKIKEDIFDKNWKPDKLVFEAIKQYEKNNYTFAVEYLNATINAAKQTIDFFNNVDYNECNEKGIYKYKVKEVLSAIKETKPILKELQELHQSINEGEMTADNRIKGEGKLGGYEE